MGAITVTFVQRDGTEVVIDDAIAGESRMEVAREHGVDGTSGDCGTCHVSVDPKWQDEVDPPNDVEEPTLDLVGHVQRSNNRLRCQIKAGPGLDELR